MNAGGGARSTDYGLDPNLVAPRPLTTVDVVVFTARSAELHVLLVRRPNESYEPYPGRWALPGGIVDVRRDKSLQDCALRKLREKTGIKAPYLEQLGSWGSPSRDPRGWSATHVYLSLVSPDDIQRFSALHSPTAEWRRLCDVSKASALAFDHSSLVKAALARLRNKVEYTSLPMYLMPREFTLSDLQRTYETILSRPLEKKAFRTRVLAVDVLEVVPRKTAGASRPAQLYRIAQPDRPHLFVRPFGTATLTQAEKD